MDVRRIRAELRMGRPLYDLPLRVTFYARVSTDQDEQINSLENQVQYYTELIQSRPAWRFVPGYIDEGISGGTTKKRDDFNRMIRDAKAGMFDFIITKEISRFSRSTLDSIKYTQELLENNVGVLFQNDNINTLDTDSEFRLVIMAGVAQDEIRKLSERLKFGFRQAIKNGHVLGNDKLYGYDKKDCVLTINEKEAEIIRLVFDLYGNQRLGVRTVSKRLTELGYTSREGNAFNTLTIRHILENPKYKGWYCGNKTRSMDYRKKKALFLNESEWVSYPDPSIPAIVPEEVWDRANALFKQRSARAKAHGVGYQSRYPYSGKIICGKHGTSFHRQSFKTKEGETEFWRCKIYRQHGRAGCDLPAIRTGELDAILAEQFRKLVKHQKQIVCLVMDSIADTQQKENHTNEITRLEAQMRQMENKKDKLLELSVADAITMQEFKKRNNRFNEQIAALQAQVIFLQREQQEKSPAADMEALEKALWADLNGTGSLRSETVATILDHAVVCEDSDAKRIHLELYLRLSQTVSAYYQRDKLAFQTTCSRSTTPRPATRRT